MKYTGTFVSSFELFLLLAVLRVDSNYLLILICDSFPVITDFQGLNSLLICQRTPALKNKGGFMSPGRVGTLYKHSPNVKNIHFYFATIQISFPSIYTVGTIVNNVHVLTIIKKTFSEKVSSSVFISLKGFPGLQN